MIATPRPLLGRRPWATPAGTDIQGVLRSVILQPEFTQTFTPSPTAVATSTASVAGKSVTGLVMDVSGSMGEVEASGKTKLDGAKAAANVVLDRMIQENSLGRAQHQAGLITFGNTAQVAISPTGDLAAVKRAVQGMAANGQTNMGDGLAKALDDLQSATVLSRTMILLSDGQANVGLICSAAVPRWTGSPRQVRGDLPPCCGIGRGRQAERRPAAIHCPR